MHVDLRTRRDEPRAAVDPEAFFTDDLPDAIARQAELIRPGVDWIRPKPLTIAVNGREWTLVHVPDAPHGIAASGVVLNEGGGGRTRIALDAAHLDDLVSDQQSMMGLWVGGTIGGDGEGKLGDALNWWLVMRAALDGAPVYTPGSVALTDADGRPLALDRTFRYGVDDPEEMHEFLMRAGFLHIGGLFDAAEMDAVAVEMDRAVPNYSQGDGRSWWARDADGTDHLVRMQGFDHESDTARDLLGDRRFLDLAELSHAGHRFARKRSDNWIEALFKPLGIVAGVSDIGWHKDCGIGRHSYDCCGMTVGISVTGAGPTSGQLHALAGSHRALVWSGSLQPHVDLPDVPLATDKGDVTIHLSCTMHMAQPPETHMRRVMYSGFSLPPLAAKDGTEPTSDERAAALARNSALREQAPLTALARNVHS
ncbi:MAG TPA: phytanoyl-CoA dioxygenase family protein [Acidimicrobiia bacterium]